MTCEIQVDADWLSSSIPCSIGSLSIEVVRGKETYYFSYDSSWLNTDDHLRNHGFLLTDKGWRLSPAFDLNPDPNGTGLALNISELDNALDLNLARQVAPYFRLEKPAAETIIAEVAEAVSQWRAVATHHAISRAEQTRMQSAFAALE